MQETIIKSVNTVNTLINIYSISNIFISTFCRELRLIIKLSIIKIQMQSSIIKIIIKNKILRFSILFKSLNYYHLQCILIRLLLFILINIINTVRSFLQTADYNVMKLINMNLLKSSV